MNINNLSEEKIKSDAKEYAMLCHDCIQYNGRCDPGCSECEKRASYYSYIDGAKAAKEEYDKLCDCGEASDGYHTFNQLYDFRREYNAALVNSGIWPAHKSYRHHTGELCFDGGWFIVMIQTPFGQISNHYENKYWDEFHCEEKEVADEWDGHTELDALERLHNSNLNMK